MDKKQILKKKLVNLSVEVEKAKKYISKDKVLYLNNFKKYIENIIKRIEDDSIPASNGGVIGTMRAISEYDDLSSIESLYYAACDVDLFYSQECKQW